MLRQFKLYGLLLIALMLFGCATTSRDIQKKDPYTTDYSKYQLIGPKKRVIIAEFENKTAYGQRRLGAGISDILTTELSKTNCFILLERQKLEAILEEHKLGASGLVDENSAPQLGKLIGANALITGSVTQFGVRTETTDIILTSEKKQIASCSVDIRVVDLNTGQITWAGSGQGEAIRTYTNVLGSGKGGGYDETLEGDAFRAAIIKVMENLFNALANLHWFCTVAKVSDTKIYINAGQKSNLDLNTKLSIYRVGEPIIDPTTGMELGKEEAIIGTAVVNSYFGEDGAILSLVDGSNPQIGDICKLH